MPGLRVPAPNVSRKTQTLLAGVMWAAAGAGLMIAGTRWTLLGSSRAAVPLLSLAALGGGLKARLLLDKTAGRIARRIEQRGDNRCIAGFLSWKSWLLVAGMIGLGRLVRASPLPLVYRGAIYFAIGAALLIASRLLWRRWWVMKSGSTAASAGPA